MLAAYVKSLVPAHQSLRAFCQEHGLDNARVSAWENAQDVSIDSMRDFADRFEMTLGQVLIIAGYGTPDDFGGAVPPEPKPPTPPSLRDAIDHDPDIDEAHRDVLRAVATGFGYMQQGASSFTQKSPKPARRVRK